MFAIGRWVREYWLVLCFVVAMSLFVLSWNNWVTISYYLSNDFSKDLVRDHPLVTLPGDLSIVAMFVVFFIVHLKLPHEGLGKHWIIVGTIAIFAPALIYVGFFKTDVPITTFVAILLCFGIALFICVSELLYSFGFGEYLTMTRGEKWVKEIEYIYLLLGAISIASAMGKFTRGSHWLDFEEFSPLILTLAVVIRCVKTRAEIGEWNKEETYNRK